MLDFISSRRTRSLGLCLLAPLFLIACNSEKGPSPAMKEEAKAIAAQPHSATLTLPANLERHTSDLDDMVKRRNIRALVILNPIGFFYQNGHPKGAL